jgi:hypothetical protein
MARIRQIQNIDVLIENINAILQNRYSLSDEDVKILEEALALLKSLRKKKGRTSEQVLQVIVDVVSLLTKFFR